MINISNYISKLIDISKNFQNILTTLENIKDINIFINLINEKSNKIMRLSKIEKQKIELKNYFVLNQLEYENFNELFYSNLYNIKTVEKEDYKFLSFDISLNDFFNPSKQKIILKKFIFYYLINDINKEKDENKIILDLLSSCKQFILSDDFGTFSNTEMMILGEIISQIEFEKNILLKHIFKLINFQNINKEFNSIFKKFKINWKCIFESKMYFIKAISKKILTLSNPDKVVIIFDLLNKLNEYREIDHKKVHGIIDSTLSLVQQKYLQYYKTNQGKINEENIKVISELISLCDKNKKPCFLLNIKNSEYIEKILLYTLKNNKISYSVVENPIKTLINKEKFKIIEILIEQKMDYLDELLNCFIIQEKDILEENISINYKLLNFLIEKNYFTTLNNTNYSIKTSKLLEEISTRITNMQNISYKQIKLLRENQKKIEIITFIKNDINITEICDGQITKIEDLVKKYNEVIELLETIKFSGFDSTKEKVKKFIETIKDKIIDSNAELNYYELQKILLVKLIKNFEEKVFSEFFYDFLSKFRTKYKRD